MAAAEQPEKLLDYSVKELEKMVCNIWLDFLYEDYDEDVDDLYDLKNKYTIEYDDNCMTLESFYYFIKKQNFVLNKIQFQTKKYTMNEPYFLISDYREDERTRYCKIYFTKYEDKKTKIFNFNIYEDKKTKKIIIQDVNKEEELISEGIPFFIYSFIYDNIDSEEMEYHYIFSHCKSFLEKIKLLPEATATSDSSYEKIKKIPLVSDKYKVTEKTRLLSRSTSTSDSFQAIPMTSLDVRKAARGVVAATSVSQTPQSRATQRMSPHDIRKAAIEETATVRTHQKALPKEFRPALVPILPQKVVSDSFVPFQLITTSMMKISQNVLKNFGKLHFPLLEAIEHQQIEKLKTAYRELRQETIRKFHQDNELGQVIVPVDDDGTCLFKSISMITGIDYRRLYELVNKKEPEWGTDEDIELIAFILRRNIVVKFYIGRHPNILTQRTNIQHPVGDDILLFIHGSHFDPIMLRPEFRHEDEAAVSGAAVSKVKSGGLYLHTYFHHCY
jgi:hypothetical protein